MVWEEEKGSARGSGEVKPIIPNQIEINRIATRRAIAVKIGAFNRLIVNKDLIDNPSALEKVGVTIKIKGGTTTDDVKKAIGYLAPQNISSDASNLQQELQTDTRELAGAGDTVTGQVDPTKASGKAIIAVQQASQQPLNEQLETYKTFLEDLARIYFDMWKAYRVNGIQILIKSTNEEGDVIQQPFTVSQDMLQNLKANIKIEITPRSAYDKYAQEQSIENLMINQKITFEEYENKDVYVAGRIMSRRGMGKVAFLDLRDMYAVLQVVVRDGKLLEGIRKEQAVSIQGHTTTSKIILHNPDQK